MELLLEGAAFCWPPGPGNRTLMDGIFLESSKALKMPKKGKILSLPSATWFLSPCGVCWDQGGCPTPLPALLHRQKGSAREGQILGGISQGEGEWEFVPQQAANQAGMSP